MKKKFLLLLEIVIVCFILYQGYRIYELKKAEWNFQKKQAALLDEIKGYDNQKKSSGKSKEEEDNIAKETVGKLKKKYPDVVAIINIPGTTIKYPILQAKDNSYYLRRDITGKYDVFGEVFMDYRNHSNLTDQNTIVYGHNVEVGGAVFNGLLNYTKKEFFDKNPVIEILSLDGVKKYQVFAAYVTEPQAPYREVNYDDNREWTSFIEGIQNRSVVKTQKQDGVERILTLSTCADRNNRMVLHGKELKR